MDVYGLLRSIGVSLDMALTLEPILQKLPQYKRTAYILWASGMSGREVARYINRDEKVIRRLIATVRKQVRECTYITDGTN